MEMYSSLEEAFELCKISFAEHKTLPKSTRKNLAFERRRIRFHMTSWRPYLCPKTMKRRPCWCPKPVLWELTSFLMQTLSFVRINLHTCWSREWKHRIVEQIYIWYPMTTGLIRLTLIYFISREFVSLRRRRLSWPPGETSQAARS